MNRGNAWCRRVRANIIADRGGKCETCDGPGPFEFHHVKPTGLNGRGRGFNARVLDVLRHPKAYIMLCEECHRREHL